MIAAGSLNRRITVEHKTSTSNAFGEMEESWLELATVWAGLKLLTTKDVNRQQGLKEQAEAKFLIRHRSDITSQMRVNHKGEIYHIIGTEEYQDGEGLLLFVRRT